VRQRSMIGPELPHTGSVAGRDTSWTLRYR